MSNVCLISSKRQQAADLCEEIASGLRKGSINTAIIVYQEGDEVQRATVGNDLFTLLGMAQWAAMSIGCEIGEE